MSHKLLLADDSVTIQRVVELTFSGENIDVVTVSDGEQAIARISADPPDIVLADIAMPKKNGYEVAAFVKDHPTLSKVPVLLLAGAFEPVDEERAKKVRSDGVLVKPFETHEVIARVWAQLGQYRGHAALESWVFRFCEFELINAVRRKRRRPGIALDDVAAEEPRRSGVDNERVYQCLDRLLPEEAAAVRLKHFAELTFEEIAARERAPLATVKSRYYRALEKLRFWLAPLRGGEEA